MTKTIYIAAAAALLTIAPFVETNAFTRSGTFVGPRGGTTTWQSQRSCSGGTCTGSRTVTGPAGRTRTWEGTRTCSGGSCTSQGSYTGPAGNTWTRQGSSTCSGGQCSYGGTVTGAARPDRQLQRYCHTRPVRSPPARRSRTNGWRRADAVAASPAG